MRKQRGGFSTPRRAACGCFTRGPFLNRIYQEGSEASAAVVAVETHTIHKLEEGLGELLPAVGVVPPLHGHRAGGWGLGASLRLCPHGCWLPGGC